MHSYHLEWDTCIWRLKLFEAPSRTEQKHECERLLICDRSDWFDSILEGNP
jgi:hypothetical protein